MWKELFENYLKTGEIESNEKENNDIDLHSILTNYVNDVLMGEAIKSRAEIARLKDPELRPWLDVQGGTDSIWKKLSDEDKKNIETLGKMANNVLQKRAEGEDAEEEVNQILHSIDKFYKKVK